jgi:hypothetical protein
MKRRSAVEPVIGHLKDEHRMGRNYLGHRHGDFNNAILAAVGDNFHRLIRWLSILLRLFLAALFVQPNALQRETPFFTDHDFQGNRKRFPPFCDPALGLTSALPPSCP